MFKEESQDTILSQRIQAQGEKVIQRDSPLVYQFSAIFLDAVLYTSVLSIYLFLVAPLNLPTFSDLLACYFIFLLIQLPFLLLTQSSLGEKIWQLKGSSGLIHAENQNTLMVFIVKFIFWPLTSKKQIGIFGGFEVAKTISLTVALCTLSFALIDFSFLENPTTAKLEIENIPFRRVEPEKTEHLAFFSTEALWPSNFLGESIFYQLPYEKGPPFKHISKIIAKWNAPEILVTIEGPRTPLQNEERNIQQIKSCFTKSSTSILETKCLNLRKKILARHFEEATVALGRFVKPTLKWIEITHPQAEVLTQGIYIEFNPTDEFQLQKQVRAIIFKQDSSMQSFILDYQNTSSGEEAKKAFNTVLASMKTIQEFNPIRTLIDGEIAHLKKSDPDFQFSRKRLNLSLSKITIDPQNFENYYQTLEEIQKIREKQLQSSSSNYTHSPQLKGLFQNLMKYAYDTAAIQRQDKEEKLVQIQRLWSQFK